MEPTIDAVALGDGAAGLGVWALVMQADLVVKAVMLVLLAASVWCWAVILDKGVRLTRLKRRAASFERDFWSGTPLDELYRRLAKRIDHPMAMMFAAAIEEWREAPRSTEPAVNQSLVSRVGRVMELTMDREVSVLERHLPSLATIGSTAPFIGLFGTVWGIMNSFQSIAVTKNTTLAVVAPGIAEALIATAMGLFAAIPAVIAYNRFADRATRLELRYDTFTEEFTALLQRHSSPRSA